MPQPKRGDVWLADFGNPVGHEQGMTRPCVIVSEDTFNHGPAELVVVVPCTSTDKGIPLHVVVSPPEGGLTSVSYFKPEDVRSISTRRLLRRWGQFGAGTMNVLVERLQALLDL